MLAMRVAHFIFNSNLWEKLSVEVRHVCLLADVFSAQHLPAGFALEAAEVPLTTQG